MSAKHDEKFRQSMSEQRSMRFKTRHPDGDNYDGIVRHIGRAFIALREVRDFEVDGVIVLPKRAIRGFRDGKFEVCENEILRQSGTLKKLRVPPWLPRCETIADVFENLMRRSVWPGIETLRVDGSTAFYLGPLKDIAEDRVSIRCYDAAGKWEKTYDLPVQDVFRIEFDSRYCNLFNRYMQSKEPAT